MKKLISLLIALALISGAALADSITLTGSVTAREEKCVTCAIGGTVAAVYAQAGQTVKKGDVIAELETEKVYAPVSGTVTGVFGAAGDAVEEVESDFGAVMYIESDCMYTIAANTDYAYADDENYIVHSGESVYLSCYSDATHTGRGVITAIDGSDYTVRVTEGDFLVGETVNVYRGTEVKTKKRIGRGTLSRTNPVAVSGAGSIVNVCVADGDSVEKGDLLFETLSGTFDGYVLSGTQITAADDGVISEVSVSAGDTVEKGTAIAKIYPFSGMQVVAEISQYNLSCINKGDEVTVELLYDGDEEVLLPGTVSMISAIANESETEDVTYDVYVAFAHDGNARFGMTATVTTPETEDEEELDPEEDAADEEEEPESETEEDDGRPEPPEGMEFPEGMPEPPEGAEFPEGMPEFPGNMPGGEDGASDEE